MQTAKNGNIKDCKIWKDDIFRRNSKNENFGLRKGRKCDILPGCAFARGEFETFLT